MYVCMCMCVCKYMHLLLQMLCVDLSHMTLLQGLLLFDPFARVILLQGLGWDTVPFSRGILLQGLGWDIPFSRGILLQGLGPVTYPFSRVILGGGDTYPFSRVILLQGLGLDTYPFSRVAMWEPYPFSRVLQSTLLQGLEAVSKIVIPDELLHCVCKGCKPGVFWHPCMALSGCLDAIGFDTPWAQLLQDVLWIIKGHLAAPLCGILCLAPHPSATGAASPPVKLFNEIWELVPHFLFNFGDLLGPTEGEHMHLHSFVKELLQGHEVLDQHSVLGTIFQAMVPINQHSQRFWLGFRGLLLFWPFFKGCSLLPFCKGFCLLVGGSLWLQNCHLFGNISFFKELPFFKGCCLLFFKKFFFPFSRGAALLLLAAVPFSRDVPVSSLGPSFPFLRLFISLSFSSWHLASYCPFARALFPFSRGVPFARALFPFSRGFPFARASSPFSRGLPVDITTLLACLAALLACLAQEAVPPPVFLPLEFLQGSSSSHSSSSSSSSMSTSSFSFFLLIAARLRTKNGCRQDMFMCLVCLF